MPMGSLCANRNMIGVVLVVRPSLKQENLGIVAVLVMLLANVMHKEISFSANATHPTILTTMLLLPETHQPRVVVVT